MHRPIRSRAREGAPPGRDVARRATAGAGRLRALRRQVTDRLLGADRVLLGSVAGAAGRLPVALVAGVARRALGPPLVARVAGHLEPGRAAQVAARLPAPFLAEVARELDPRRAPAVLAGIPVERLVDVARDLAARGDVAAMGRLVGALPDAAVARCVDVLDAPTVLRTASVLEDKSRLDALVAALGDARVPAVLRAAQEEGLWPEALDLLGHLGPGQRRRVAALAAEEDNALLAGLVRAARAERRLGEVLTLLPALARGRLR